MLQISYEIFNNPTQAEVEDTLDQVGLWELSVRPTNDSKERTIIS